MIKINKDIRNIPNSLKIPNYHSFPNGVSQQTKNTHKRRLELISRGQYIYEDKYNNRYKAEDIKSTLSLIYKNKCAFCEQKVEQFHVEHFRPKRTYYWLAFSWDNLLLACHTCNQNKGSTFEIEGTLKSFSRNKKSINTINSSSREYDAVEKPKMVNPENTDPIGKLEFRRSGGITSKHKRFLHTIEKCKIDRDYLNDSRRKLLEAFKEDITAELFSSNTIEEQKVAIQTLIRKFTRDANTIENEYIAFRKFALKEKWLNEIIKELVN